PRASSRSWPGPYPNGSAGGRTLALRRNDDIAVGTQEDRERQVACGQRLGLAAVAAHRHEFGEADSRGDLAREGERFGRFFYFFEPGETVEHVAAVQQPDRERGIHASGQQQHRPRADEAERRGFAWRERDPVHRDAAGAREGGHALVVTAASGAADQD